MQARYGAAHKGFAIAQISHSKGVTCLQERAKPAGMVNPNATSLPIDDVLADIAQALSDRGVCVLQAPPGAGKTTRVPLALLEAGITGKIIMLEPRRLAARAAAERMAETLGEKAGQTVGYRMRGSREVSPQTRIEVVTEGILTRMLQSDPDLPGIGLVIFDEFHERSLNGDLGLALTWESRQTLRPDLKILVMSATLDAAPVAALLEGAPVVTSQGRSFPVETRWLERPRKPDANFVRDLADLVMQAAKDDPGGILVFLPGARDIQRVGEVLKDRSIPNTVICPLYGALPFADQRKAIRPNPDARKIVLATSIAETSLTIEDVRVVVDGGLTRRSRFDPNSGMSRLITEPVSRAEAVQRQGRAGRVAPGICYRFWTRAAEGALPEFPPAEIEATDLAGLALNVAAWGTDIDDLALLTPPPEGAFAKAQDLLRMLDAMEGDGRLTPHGQQMAAIPVHPRLAHMILSCDDRAATIAALLSERDVLGHRAGSDLELRLRAVKRGEGPKPLLAAINAETKRLARFCKGPRRELGEMAALAYPDRVGLRRPGQAARYLLSGGKGAKLEDADALAGKSVLVALDLDGDAREARIRLAAPLSEAGLRDVFAGQITLQESCFWSKQARCVKAVRRERFGALILSEQKWKQAPSDQVIAAFLEGVRDIGLGGLYWTKSARAFRARVQFLSRQDPTFPDWSDAGLMDTTQNWLAPFVAGLTTADDIARFDPEPALRAALGWQNTQALDVAAPAFFETPLGRKLALDYGGEGPEISVRLQEMFGVTRHPVIGPDRVPLKVTLLSPAQRPVQVTTDLPGFWRSSYADVRKDMRGRYPRHHWPEDPTEAAPTLRAKPRGT